MEESIILIVAVVFYILVPLFGAYLEYKKWQRFRKTFINSSKYPILKYQDIALENTGNDSCYRFFGYLEAMEDNDKIWVKNEQITVSAEVKDVDIYLLPFSSDNLSEDNVEINNFIGPEDRPIKTSWKRINSLSEKTRIFIFGRLHKEKDKKIFMASKDAPLFIVLHDCSDECILRRSVWSGRPINDYWNVLTPGSLAIASFGLFIYSYILLRFPLLKFQAVMALSVSLFPFLPFLPPGLFFYLIYKKIWARAKLLRAEKDLLKLPLKYFNDENTDSAVLPDNSKYTKKLFSLFHEALKYVELDKCRIRLSSAQKKTKEKEYFVFGQEKGSYFSKPVDPMAELVLVNGDPDYLSGLNKKKAIKYELFSIVLLLAAFFINYVISFRIIRYFVM